MVVMDPYEQYKRSSVEHAPPEKLLLMLYDGLVKFLERAKQAIKKKDIAGANNNLIRSQNIILELMATLNLKQGGEIAKSLYSLYDYMYYRLIDANIKKDEGIVDEVLGFIVELRSTWEEAVKKLSTSAVSKKT